MPQSLTQTKMMVSPQTDSTYYKSLSRVLYCEATRPKFFNVQHLSFSKPVAWLDKIFENGGNMFLLFSSTITLVSSAAAADVS